ncbi:hypothetical protein TNCV_5119381 [Trichonephila clavipes]|nr:hypothetical protein TNCV_5119381 [Trichonephila clavipes]
MRGSFLSFFQTNSITEALMMKLFFSPYPLLQTSFAFSSGCIKKKEVRPGNAVCWIISSSFRQFLFFFWSFKGIMKKKERGRGWKKQSYPELFPLQREMKATYQDGTVYFVPLNSSCVRG